MPIFNNEYTDREWFLMRLFYVLIWSVYIIFIINSYESQPTPTGISQYIDFSFMTWSFSKKCIYIVGGLSAYCYVKGENLLSSSFVMLLLSIGAHTFHESQGGNQRNELMTLILLSQFVAFAYGKFMLRKGLEGKEKIKNLAITNSIQIFVATYFIAGITKLQTSGVNWVLDSPNIALQIYKSQMSNYTSTLYPIFKYLAIEIPYLITNYPFLTQFIFGACLALELFGFMALYSRKASFIVGVLFVVLNLGILVVMGVFFIPFLYFNLLFLVNIPSFFNHEK